LAKSAEALEKKRVEFLESAKKCKRVRKGLIGKGIARKQVETFEQLHVEYIPPSKWIVLKTKELREEHFVSC